MGESLQIIAVGGLVTDAYDDSGVHVYFDETLSVVAVEFSHFLIRYVRSTIEPSEVLNNEL